jgi:hypothetical protein
VSRAGLAGHGIITARRLAARAVIGLVFALLLFALPIANAIMALVAADLGDMRPIASADAAPAAQTKAQADALAAYNDAAAQFKSVLSERRARIDANQPLPNLPGQALYLARIAMMSAYKDLTDLMPAKIGRPNKFGIPPAYFDADNEPLLDEYKNLFAIMQAPPADAQNSDTPFHDVVDLATAIARAKGLDPANAEIAGRIGLGIFFAETNGNQNIGNARSNKYKGSFQTGVSEDRIGRKKWAAMRTTIAAFDPALIARDDKEEARAGKSDHRFNHWTAVRDGLMNAHAGLFPQIPAIAQTLTDPIDQMKFFELIQIIPAPTKSALGSGNLARYVISDPTIMGYLRNNSIFTFGQADRARTSATFREILDAMWLFNDKFERALAKFDEIKTERKSQ